MATNYDNTRLANATRRDLLRALEECREQLRRAEEMLRRSRQDNSPSS